MSDIVVLRSADNEDEYVDVEEVSNENEEGPVAKEVDRDAGIGYGVNEEPDHYIPDWGDSKEDRMMILRMSTMVIVGVTRALVLTL
ncbi:hypothetical protein R1flu_007366 [Riccia fluitans]|uniref:Uncharacterized protein n=1 Tax=Riccia fluitans TaxID=41844 RepID=A0ABD1Z2S6_9MARC